MAPLIIQPWNKNVASYINFCFFAHRTFFPFFFKLKGDKKDSLKSTKHWPKEKKRHKKRKAIQCSWIKRLELVKMSNLSKAVYKFGVIPIKIPIVILMEIF